MQEFDQTPLPSITEIGAAHGIVVADVFAAGPPITTRPVSIR